MIPLIFALGLKVDFEMFSDNFYRTEVSDTETAFFVNMKGHLYCMRISLDDGEQKKKSFYIQHFEAIPTPNLVKRYNKLMEETPWVLR